MKKLGLVVGCLLLGTVAGAYFYHAESFAPAVQPALAPKPDAQSSPVSEHSERTGPEHADPDHEHKPSETSASHEAEHDHETRA
ncbi:MAG: hypothetical protein J0H04_02805 [Hyphomicrobium denitrificans]|nr:hypothetical protein [Hyphomicrobium denitrificans]